MATTNSVIELLQREPPAERFTPYIDRSPEADALTAHFKPDADYSKRLNDHVTLFLSIDTNEIVGCRIKGIRGILADLPNYIKVNHDDVELSIIFWSFRGGADEEQVKAFNELASKSRGMKVGAPA